MTPMEIGNGLVALCRQKKNLEAIDKFYSATVESIEAEATPQIGKIQKGIEAIKGKNRQWFENSQIHGPEVNGPFRTAINSSSTSRTMSPRSSQENG
jgi:hypothetical protein